MQWNRKNEPLKCVSLLHHDGIRQLRSPLLPYPLVPRKKDAPVLAIREIRNEFVGFPLARIAAFSRNEMVRLCSEFAKPTRLSSIQNDAYVLQIRSAR